MKYGKWWAIQWSFDGWVSFGVHLDFRVRYNESVSRFYGPYVDIHFLWFILSLGVNPIYAGELDLKTSVSRGGINGDSRN